MQAGKLKPIAPYVVGQVVGQIPRASRGPEEWLLGHCVGKSDDHVAKVLKNAHIEEYYPQIREFRPLPKKMLSHKQRAAGIEVKRPILVPLLPRYRLMRVDPRRSDLHDVFALAGIGGLVCEGGVIVTVPHSFFEHVCRLESEGAIPGSTSARIVFAVGDRVRIAGDGPFAGFNAMVEKGLDIPIEELDPDMRIKVAIALLGRPSTLDLTVSEVQKL